MNNTFKANLIKTLANKKGNKGFTLIELLVVVIIIGVLAAIALPNLLGQVGKARESEAKSQMGAMTRAQQGYFTEYADFAATAEELEVPVGNEKYYVITVENDGATPPSGTGIMWAQGMVDDPATAESEIAAQALLNTPIAQADAQIANGKNGTRDYTGGISYHQFDRTFATVVCRAANVLKPQQYAFTDAAGTFAAAAGSLTAPSSAQGSPGYVGGAENDGLKVGCENDQVSIEVK